MLDGSLRVAELNQGGKASGVAGRNLLREANHVVDSMSLRPPAEEPSPHCFPCKHARLSPLPYSHILHLAVFCGELKTLNLTEVKKDSRAAWATDRVAEKSPHEWAAAQTISACSETVYFYSNLFCIADRNLHLAEFSFQPRLGRTRVATRLS